MVFKQNAAGSVMAAGLALALSTCNPELTLASTPTPSLVRPHDVCHLMLPVVLRHVRVHVSHFQVQQGSSSLLAEEDLRPAQKKFLEERAVSTH